MWLIIRDAKEIAETYTLVARLQLQAEKFVEDLDKRWEELKILRGKIATLEIENETLQREVEHWKAETSVAKSRVQVKKGAQHYLSQ